MGATTRRRLSQLCDSSRNGDNEMGTRRYTKAEIDGKLASVYTQAQIASSLLRSMIG